MLSQTHRKLRASVLPALMAVLLLSGCQADQIDGGLSFLRDQVITIEATYELPDIDTKTVRDDNAKIYWTPGDAISLFYDSGTDGGSKFIAQNDAVALKTTFSGSITAVTGGSDMDEEDCFFWGLYPYDETASCDGHTVTMRILSEQPGMEGTFAPGYAPSLGRSQKLALPFRNIWSGFGFTVSEAGYQTVTFKGNNNEDLAGRAKIGIDASGLPYVVEILEGIKEVTITAPTNAGFVPGQYYYMQFFPGTLSGGFTVKISNATKTGTWVYDKSMTYPRSTWKRAANIDTREGIEWAENNNPTYVQFEDANFKAYCVKNFDKDNDGEISRQEALLVTSMTVNSEVVASLKGIEFFTNLQSLDCRLQWNSATFSGEEWHFYRNDDEVFSLLSSLDLSSNTALTSLICSSNNLTSLDVSNNTALTVLWCDFNRLSSLDISHNTALTSLSCGKNQLKSLNVSHMGGLTHLECSSNPLKSIDVSHNSSLKSLYCHSNQLTILDLSYNTLLTTVGCDNNQLQEIDLSENIVLKYLSCYNNQLSSIDVSNNTALLNFNCQNNKAGMIIYVKGGQLFDHFSHDESVVIMEKGNPIPIGNIVIEDSNFKSYCVQYHDQDSDGEISYAEALRVTSIDCPSSHIQSLSGIEHFKNLTFLACYSNLISALDVSNNVALSELICGDNKLTILDISNNKSLTSLDCGGNQLTNINVRNNAALTYLGCAGNQLASLEVDNNVSLICLDCADNQLTSIDISNNSAMTHFDCRNNPYLTTIWMKTDQMIADFKFDTSVATIKRKD